MMKASRRCLPLILAAIAAGPAAAAPDGESLYTRNCLACHGADLAGVDGLGVSLADSPFVGRLSRAELVAFLEVGRMPGDPATVSNGAMPGFDWLPPEELEAIAAFVKSGHGG